MKTKLNLPERLVLLDVLPKEGNFLAMRTMRKLRESLALSPEEIDEYEVKIGENRISWNPQKSEFFKEFDFEEYVVGVIKLKLKELSEKEKLEEKHITLFEKFVEGEENGIIENESK